MFKVNLTQLIFYFFSDNSYYLRYIFQSIFKCQFNICIFFLSYKIHNAISQIVKIILIVSISKILLDNILKQAVSIFYNTKKICNLNFNPSLIVPHKRCCLTNFIP